MPLPSPRYAGIRNVQSYKGVILSDQIETNVFGRTTWSGNQRRGKRAKIMPPTALLTNVIKVNLKSYSRFTGLYDRSGSVRFVYSGVPGYGYISEKKSPSTSDVNGALSIAVNSFGKEAGLGETILETPSSVRLIGKRATTVFQILVLAGRGKFRAAGARLKSATGYNVSNRATKRLERKWGEGKTFDSRRASSFWLETQFGFAPLFQSVYDSLSELARSENTRRRVGREGNASYGIYGSITNQAVYSAARLGLLNPAALVWDKLPFSFVLDFFLPISTILRWLGSNRGLSVVYAWSAKTSIERQSYGSIWYRTITNYSRRVETKPSIGDIFNASSRSHGLWTVITAVSLFDTLR